MALCALVLVAVGVAGCGDEEGVAEGGTIKAYVERPLCRDDVPGILLSPGGDADGIETKFVCLPSARGPELGQGVGGGREVDLAQAGRNARLAAEDSAAVVFIEPADPAVARFTHPILEAAGIGWLTADSEREATSEFFNLLGEADTGDLRADLRDALGQ